MTLFTRSDSRWPPAFSGVIRYTDCFHGFIFWEQARFRSGGRPRGLEFRVGRQHYLESPRAQHP
jgi:hypothetical protein